MRNEAKRGTYAWIDRILSEEVQRAFLVLSGCIIFILGAFVLSLESPSVPHEIRVYAWKDRALGQATQLRALGFDRKKHGFQAVKLCQEHSSLNPINASSDGYALPLILESSKLKATTDICLKIDGWEERNFILELPQAKAAEIHKPALRTRESEIYASEAFPKFPFAHFAIPKEGVYNPMNAEATLLFWLDSETATLRYEESKDSFIEAPRGEDGLYRLPMKNRGLIGKTLVQVQQGEAIYTRELRFHPRARETTLEVESSGSAVKIKLKLVNNSVSRTHDHDESHATQLICSVMSGSSALNSVVLKLNDENPFISVDLPFAEQNNELQSIICDPNPLGGDSDSVAQWIIPNTAETHFEPFLTFLRKSLAQQMKRSMAKKLLRWYRHGSKEEKRRATQLLLAASQPSPETMHSIATSYPDDLAKATNIFQSLRNRIFAVLSLLLFLWVLMTLLTLWHRRQLRTLAIQDYLSDDPDEDVAAELLVRGKDALARPRSNLLALGIILVLLSHILGLLWVLWSL